MSGPDQCLLFGVERCPLLGGSKCISSLVKSIGGKGAVCCREVVRFSEGLLLEVLLYSQRFMNGTLSVTFDLFDWKTLPAYM